MSSTVMLISIVILIIIYPFSLYFKLKNLKHKLSILLEELEKLLEEFNNQNSEELAKVIHQRRRVFNSLVRLNNYKLDSTLGKNLAKKYDFSTQDFFKFQGE